MKQVLLGTDRLVESYKVEVSSSLPEPELRGMAEKTGVMLSDDPSIEMIAARLSAVAYKRPLDGLRLITCTFPDSMSTMECANTVTISRGFWDTMTPGSLEESGAPLWVASDSPALEALLAEHFGCPAGVPADLEAIYHTENGPPGVGEIK